MVHIILRFSMQNQRTKGFFTKKKPRSLYLHAASEGYLLSHVLHVRSSDRSLSATQSCRAIISVTYFMYVVQIVASWLLSLAELPAHSLSAKIALRSY